MKSTKSILGLNAPLFSLSPMDGVTDAAFRYIVKKYGNPDLTFTEFSNVMGICYAADKTLTRFQYSEIERPAIAQIFGAEPEWFYHAAKIVTALGFDAVDINMGCPANSVSGRGAGAGLIRTPDLAREIIFHVKKGINDWVESGKLTGLKTKQEKFVLETVENLKNKLKKEDIKKIITNSSFNINNLENSSIGILNLIDERHSKILEELINNKEIEEKIINNRFVVPTSVKTRIGYDKPITVEWIKNLEKENPAWISVHGRTLKQMYNGKADRIELKKAVEATNIPVMINGDIQNKKEALEVIKQTGAFGALIGRAAFGNPFVFVEEENVNIIERSKKLLEIMLEHAKVFNGLHENNEKAFVQMRKHFGWYTKNIFNQEVLNSEIDLKNLLHGFNSPKELRIRLMQMRSYSELEELIKSPKK